MTVRFTRPITANSRFGQQLLDVGKRQLTTDLKSVGADAVRRTEAIVAKLYDNSRTGHRSKGDVKLAGSFSFEVKPGGGSRTRGGQHVATVGQVIVTSSADDAKVGALEFGSEPHVIEANEKPMLVFDRNAQNVFGKRLNAKLGPAKNIRQKGTGRAAGAGGKGNLVKVQQVQHPGTREGRFMRGGLEGAMRAAFRKVTTSG